jgi:hypothetical protein
MDLGIGPKPLHIRSRGGRWFWVKTGAAKNCYFYGYFDVLFNNAGAMATKDYKARRRIRNTFRLKRLKPLVLASGPEPGGPQTGPGKLLGHTRARFGSEDH